MDNSNNVFFEPISFQNYGNGFIRIGNATFRPSDVKAVYIGFAKPGAMVEGTLFYRNSSAYVSFTCGKNRGDEWMRSLHSCLNPFFCCSISGVENRFFYFHCPTLVSVVGDQINFDCEINITGDAADKVMPLISSCTRCNKPASSKEESRGLFSWLTKFFY